MFTRKTIFMLLIILTMGTLIHAQSNGTIVFATRPNFIDPDTGESPDMPHIYALEDAGYEVIQFYNASLSTAEQATLDTLYDANLIVIGRSIPSLDCGNHKEAWNSITTPILCLEMWALRNTRLNWFNTADIPNRTDETVFHDANILEPDDPVFEGLDTSAPVPWVQGSMDYLNIPDAGNGIVLATLDTVGAVLYVRFEPDVDFYPGSGDYPAGHRTMIGNGRDNGGQPPFNYYNFTEESEQVFLAEVARMVALGGGGSAVEVRENATTPSTIILSQNYPNPFNPTTTIPFQLPEKSHVRLSISNMLGQEITEIVDGEYDAGQHEIVFNAGNLAAGIYFYKIKTERYTEMKKLAIVK